jgi:hypothetical protein
VKRTKRRKDTRTMIQTKKRAIRRRRGCKQRTGQGIREEGMDDWGKAGEGNMDVDRGGRVTYTLPICL